GDGLGDRGRTGRRWLRGNGFGRRDAAREADYAGHGGGYSSCQNPPATGILDHRRHSFPTARACHDPRQGATVSARERLPPGLEPSWNQALTRLQRNRYQAVAGRRAVGRAAGPLYPVGVTESATTQPPVSTDGDADIPQYRYTAALAGEIEQAWQQTWARLGTFNVANPVGTLGPADGAAVPADKMFVQDMFPYPSGEGLHVGHPLGYIATDVYARFLRMTGHNVLHALGFDAFGLPAEQYAIQTGTHPRIRTEANIVNFRRQLGRLGLGHDQRRSFSTTDVDFYKWTQWIFLQIYNAWFDTDQNKARPIAELVAEFDSGARTLDDGRTWAQLSDDERADV